MFPVAVRKRCSLTHMDCPCCSGSAMTSPAWLSDSAMWPGPCASTMISGMPSISRFQPPRMDMFCIRVAGSAQSSTWCEKYTISCCARLNSAIGTTVPAIWQCDWPNWMRAMSLIGGCCTQPESLTWSLMSTGAPHSGQVGWLGSLGCRQNRQSYVFISAPPLFPGAVMHVHGLDADPARSCHLGQVHAVSEEAGLERNLLGLHGHRGVLVEEAAGLDQDLLARAEGPLKDVAVAMQHQQPRVLGGDEPVHEHAATAVQHVGQALDPDERVLDGVRGEQEGVLADVKLHARVQRQDHELAWRVTGERDPAWAVRDRHDVRHAPDRALHPAGRLEGGERYRLVLPQQEMVLEEDGVLWRESDLRDRDELPLYLAAACREAELGHVLEPGRLAPPRV